MEESLKIFHNKELTADEAMLKVTERLAHIGSWQMNLKTGEGKWSDETFRMIGHNPGDVPPLFESMLKQVHPDDLEYVKNAVEAVRINNLSGQKINHRVINHKTNEVRHLETELIIDKDDKGEPLYALGFNLDVTSRILTEQKLKQSEARLLASQHIAHIGCWEVLLSGKDSFLEKHEYWSVEKYRILGLDPEKVEPNGTNLLQVVHPDDRDLLMKKFNEAIQYKRLYSFDHRIIRPDGSERIVHERGEVIMDEKTDTPLKIIGTIQDITERKEEEEALRNSEANLRTIFDNTTTVFILVDSNLKIVSFNKGALDGLSKELAQTLEVGKDMIGIIDQHKKQRTLDMYHRVFEGEKFKLEDYYTLLDGKVLWFEMQLLPVKVNAGKINHMIVYLSDITKRKIVEIEKEKITADLLTRNKDLEQFSYIISHNLRLPIANIIGLIDNLAMNNFQGDERKEAMSAIHISARRLDDVVMDLNKILDVRIKDNEQKQVLKLSDILYDTTNLGFIIKKENALIESDFSQIDELFTVKSYLSSIFYNLMLNSIKYRNAALTPHIIIKSEIEDSKIVVTFIDNGLGMDIPKKSDELFGLYKRFHPQINGKGVGLYMVKLQVESLGGIISVTSKVNKGSTFTIEFEKADITVRSTGT